MSNYWEYKVDCCNTHQNAEQFDKGKLERFCQLLYICRELKLEANSDYFACREAVVRAARECKVSHGDITRIAEAFDAAHIYRWVSDLEENSWYADPVRQALATGLITGYPDGTFKAEKNITIAEFVKLVQTIYYYDSPPGESTDINEPSMIPEEWKNHWAAGALEVALKNGWIESSIDPSSFINHEQAAKILWNAYLSADPIIIHNFSLYPNTGKEENIAWNESKAFTDQGSIQASYEDAVYQLYMNKIMQGYTDKSFRPDSLLSRAGAGVIAINLFVDRKEMAEPSQNQTPVVWYILTSEERTLYIREPSVTKPTLELRWEENGKVTALEYLDNILVRIDEASSIPEGVPLTSWDELTNNYDQTQRAVVFTYDIPAGLKKDLDVELTKITSVVDNRKTEICNSLGYGSLTDANWKMLRAGVASRIIDCMYPEPTKGNIFNEKMPFNNQSLNLVLRFNAGIYNELNGSGWSDGEEYYYYVSGKVWADCLMMVGGVVGSNAKHPIPKQNITRLNALGITYKNGVFTKESTVEVQLQEEQGAIAVGIPIVVKFTVEVALPALIILTNTLTMEQTLNSAISSYSTSISDIARECFDVDIKELAEMRARRGSGGITAEDIGNIAKGYKMKECVEAAKAISKALTKNKQNFELVSIQYEMKGIVVSLTREGIYGMNNERAYISENGYHVGVLYNSFIHCNVHPYGLPIEAWLNDFLSPGPYIVTPEKYQILKKW